MNLKNYIISHGSAPVKHKKPCVAIALAIVCIVFMPARLRAQDAGGADQKPEQKSEVVTNGGAGDQAAAEASDTATNEPDSDSSHGRGVRMRHRGGLNHNPRVVIGHDFELKEGETAETVVVIGGSAKIKGKVSDAVVAIGGDIDVDGEVGDAAVAVMGSVRAGESATIHGEVVAVGGKAEIAKGAKIEGETQEVDFGGAIPHVEWLKKWVIHCLLKLRPLAPQVGWVWGVYGIFLLIYFLIAAAFPKPIQACVEELTRRPATTFLMGLLTKLLLPIVLVILAITVIGVVVIPFVLAALVLGLIVGKVAILEWLGFKIGSQFSGGAFQKPLAAFFLGAIIITVLYTIPVFGMVTFGIVSVWGLGTVVMAAFGGFRREQPEKPAAPPSASQAVPPAAPLAPATPESAPAPSLAAAQEPQPATAAAPPPTQSAGGEAFAAQIPPLSPSSGAGGAAVASLPDAWAFPKASFWERMGAAFLDVVLVSILGGLVGGPPQGFLVALAYFAGMWAWKATTIGGIVLGLKVARMDGQPLTFTVALVRGLAAAFAVVVLFLGFLWIIWDNDKQGWHDKIAGTVVVKLPRGSPLVCL